jgi:LacI family transcriptional regulator
MTSRKRTPTMQDVARTAGVSQATVSLVLNSVAGVRVSDQTRLRVIQAAEELGYRRTPRLRADEREGSVIGLVIDDVAASPFAVPLLEGAREAAWEHQCIVSVVTTRNHAPIEQATVQAMLGQPVIGIVYATLITRQVTPPAIDSSVPMALLNCYDADGAYATVVPDDVAGARTLTNTLLAAGHRRIGHIAGEAWLDAGRDRIAGYREALEARGIGFDPALVMNLGSAVSAGHDGMHALLDLADPPTAVFCFNDRMAVGAFEAARERGLRVPDDLSIVGFDNDPFAASLVPGGLTTAVLPHEEMARWAVGHIFDMRHHRKAGHVVQLKLDCPLVRRKSVARPRTMAVAG